MELKNTQYETINLSDGMIVGYVYHYPCWEKGKIINGEPSAFIGNTYLDVYGKSNECPTGFLEYEKARKS